MTVTQELLGSAAVCVVAQSVPAVEAVARVQLWMGCIGPLLFIAKIMWEQLLFPSSRHNNKALLHQIEFDTQREEGIAQFVLRAAGYAPQCKAENVERLEQLITLITEKQTTNRALLKSCCE